jgi:hypothetical protein
MTNYVTTKGFFNKPIKEIIITMPTSDVVMHAGENPYEPDAALVYCDLFSDRVAERVCLLLKKELNAWLRRSVSCRGCHRRWLR